MSAEIDRVFQLALWHHKAGRAAEAEQCYRDVLGRDPDHAGALIEFARLALDLRRPEVTLALMQRALTLHPDDPILRSNLGVAQQHCGRIDAAIATHRANLADHPGHAGSYNNLGNVLKERDRLDEAIRQYRRAVALEPRDWQALNNLGTALAEAARDEEAIGFYRAALALRDDPDIRHNLSHSLLALGRLAEAWPEYEARALLAGNLATWPRFTEPRWQGEPAPGRVLLIHAEQGMGDMLQFCRYVPLVAGLGMRVVLQVHPPLIRLMQRLEGVAGVSPMHGLMPAFDLQCPALSLPHLFGTTLDTIPADVPYLSADPGDVAAWAARLGGDGRRKVGLAWAGNPHLPTDRRRSVPADRLGPLLDCPGITFYSLQKDGAAPAGVVDLMGAVGDFADTAALIANLDLVIAVDSAIAHLAGAMGKPVWLLNRYDAEWRWLRDRDDSPWYPTLRQFRQTAPGDWAGVIARVRAELARMGDPSSSHWQNGAGCSI